MLNDYSALNTMFRKTPQNRRFSFHQKEKQIDYISTKRRYLRNVKDDEANDMIHMGSDHRCIMATILINTPGKNTHATRENKKYDTMGMLSTSKKQWTPILKCPSSKKDIKKSLTIKKAATKKGNEVHDTENDAKD